MYCIHCGKKLNDEARFCSSCGAPVITSSASAAATPNAEATANPAPAPNPAPEAQIPTEDQVPVSEFFTESAQEPAPNAGTGEAAPFGQAPENTVYNPVAGTPAPEAAEPPKKKKKRVGLILGITIPLVLLLIAGVTFLLIALSMAPAGDPAPTQAYVSAGGTAFVCYGNGESLKLGENVADAIMTPDRRYVVVADRDGRLYVTDAENGEEVKLCNFNKEQETVQYFCNNQSVVYSINNTAYGKVEYHRYDFETGESVKLLSGTYHEIDAAGFGGIGYSETFSFAYAKDGNVYVYDSYATKPDKIGTYRDGAEVELVGVGADATTVAWAESEADGQLTLKVYEMGEVTTLAKDLTVNGISMTISPDASHLWVILCDKTAYYLDYEGKIQDVTFSEQLALYDTVFSTNGRPLTADDNAYDAWGFYVRAGDTVYLVDASENEHAKLTNDVYAWYVNDDMLYYVDSDSTLYAATIDSEKLELADKDKVDTRVATMRFAFGETDYLYYAKKSTGTQDAKAAPKVDLYVYDTTIQDATKIRSDVSSAYYVSADGTLLYYFDSPVRALTDDGDVVYGTLKCYDANTDKSESIRTEVVVSSLTSNLMMNEIDPKSMWFRSYENLKNGSYQYNILYYNGDEPTVKVKNMTE